MLLMLWLPGELSTMLRSEASSRTTYPQGFMDIGLPVSRDQGYPEGAGAGSVFAKPVTVG